VNTDDERAIVDGATPGPWTVEPELRGYEMGIVAPFRYGWLAPYAVVSKGIEGDGGIDSDADAVLIARARTVLPLALDVVAAAEAWSEADELVEWGSDDEPAMVQSMTCRNRLYGALDAWRAAQ
jgi:hypothetical protein